MGRGGLPERMAPRPLRKTKPHLKMPLAAKDKERGPGYYPGPLVLLLTWPALASRHYVVIMSQYSQVLWSISSIESA